MAYGWRYFYKKWQGDPRNFLVSCNWDAPLILARLKADSHIRNGKRVPDFPFLRGDKIGPLWLRMLRDNAGLIQIENMNEIPNSIGIRNLDKVPIPVDIHVARATLALGVVRGQYNGPTERLLKSSAKPGSRA